MQKGVSMLAKDESKEPGVLENHSNITYRMNKVTGSFPPNSLEYTEVLVYFLGTLSTQPKPVSSLECKHTQIRITSRNSTFPLLGASILPKILNPRDLHYRNRRSQT